MKKWEDVKRVPAPALIPSFGPLSGVRVLTTGGHLAMPFAATMLADFGAEICYIERPGIGDAYRVFGPALEGKNGKKVSSAWVQDARNRLSIALESNLKVEEAREVFYALVKNADIWLENLVWTEKLGIKDEDLLKVNPALVIVHISGYGRPQFGGDPDLCDRGSFDVIGQASSGWLTLNGPADGPPFVAKPGLNDYVSAMFATFGALTAYIHARKTGKGQVVDVAQFEAQSKLISDYLVLWANEGVMRKRTGNKQYVQPYDVFNAKDKEVVVGVVGPLVFARFIKAMNLDPEVYTFENSGTGAEALESEKGRALDRFFRDWVAQRTAQEVEDYLAKFKIPAQVVNDASDILDSAHWNDRGDIVEYVDQTTQRTVKAIGIVPKMDQTPGQVWRGAPDLGQDTEAILAKICGYTEEDIAELRAKRVIG